MNDSILEAIGNTPLIRLKEIEVKYNINAHLYAKLEYFNPFGSIKDRAALQIIEDAEKNHDIESGIIVESSSGNLGIALSAIANLRGYKATIVIPENMSASRFKLLEKYGANIIKTKYGGMSEAIDVAHRIAISEGGYFCDQFNNISSIKAHIISTAPEIDNALNGNIDAIICGIGSGGTISGVGTYFKSKGYHTKILGVEPNLYPHKIPGIGAGFTPSILNLSIIDGIYQIDYEDAIQKCEALLKHNSVLVGISSGAILHAGLEYAKKSENYKQNVVMIFPDSGERYL